MHHPGEVERQALIRTVTDAYMEVFPTDTILERLSVLPKNAWVAVTCSPAKGVDATLTLCEQVIAKGFRVVPHIAAKMVRDDKHLDEILRRIGDSPIESVFVPGGDAKEPAGKFTTAFQLLRAIHDRPHNFRLIGIGAHPEGHPSVADDVMLAELEKKAPLATYLVTQMCFDSKALGAWLEMIRARGITIPAWIGIPGEADRTSLLTTSLRIGVGNSLRYLKNHGNIALNLLKHKNYRPDEFLQELAPWIANPAMNVAGYHLYCFNQVQRCDEWRHSFIKELQGRSGAEAAAEHHT
jgi:methylenetetrahydrofolate reductase (NADPH)